MASKRLLEQVSVAVATAHSQGLGRHPCTCKHLCLPVPQVDVEEDDELAGLDMAPSDAEATIMLLRSKLYPDPAAAAATAAAAKQSRHAKRSKGAAGPSRATAAAVTAAAAAAAAAQQLPPLVFKTQLYTVLTDRTAADRDVEDLRRQGRVRVFKLGMGKQHRGAAQQEEGVHYGCIPTHLHHVIAFGGMLSLKLQAAVCWG